MTFIAVTPFVVLLVLAGLLFARNSREKPSPQNNWKNEDYLSRQADGTWAEGSTSSKSEPHGGIGL